MKRLVDEHEAKDASTVELIDAMRSTEVDPHMKTRVLAQVRSGARARRRTRLRPVGVLASLVVLCLFGLASAMIWRQVTRRPAPEISPTTPQPPIQAQPQAQPEPITTAPPIEPSPPRPPAHKPTLRTHIEQAQEAPAVAPPIVAEPPAAPSAAESQLLLEAYRALRQSHDPARARAKVDDYLTLYPRGALTQEALELAIEATESNPLDALPYAEKYLAKFPSGKAAKRARAIVEEND